MIPDTVDGLRAVMADHDYVLSDGLAVSLFLALRKRRPLFRARAAGVARELAARAEEAAPEDVWMACDACGKWRHLPASTGPLPPMWW